MVVASRLDELLPKKINLYFEGEPYTTEFHVVQLYSKGNIKIAEQRIEWLLLWIAVCMGKLLTAVSQMEKTQL